MIRAFRCTCIARFTMQLAAISTLSGCAVGPDYEPPAESIPRAFINTEGNTQAENDLSKWWESFGDPLLGELVREAVTANLDVQLAQARVLEARALLTGSRSGFFPNVATSGTYRRSRSSRNGSRSRTSNDTGDGTDQSGSGNFDGSGSALGEETSSYDAGFDAIWELDFFGGVRREIEASRGRYEAQVEAHRDVLISLVAEVARAYIYLRSTQRELEITKGNVVAQRETLDIQRLRLDAGLATELTVAQARAQLESTEAGVPPLEGAILQSVHRIGVLLGREPTAFLEKLLPPRPIPQGPVAVGAGIPSELLTRRPDIRQAERLLAAANAEIGAATADLFPRVRLNGSLGLRSKAAGSLFESDSVYWSAGPSIEWALLQWFAVLANIEVQSARHEQALLTYRRTALESLEEVENGLVAYRQERVRRERLAIGVAANREAHDLARQLYQAGVADFLDVLIAQRAVYQAEVELAQSERAIANNLVILYKALGGGWDAD